MLKNQIDMSVEIMNDPPRWSTGKMAPQLQAAIDSGLEKSEGSNSIIMMTTLSGTIVQRQFFQIFMHWESYPMY